MISQHFVTCVDGLFCQLLFFFSFLSLVGLFGVAGTQAQPDQLCNDFVVMCYEIQIQIAGLI